MTYESLNISINIFNYLYAAVLFANLRNETHAVKAIVIYALLGLLFFVSGIGLIRTIKDL